jgi:hypothetical protein
MPGVEGLYHDVAGEVGPEIVLPPHRQMGRGTMRSMVEG